MRHPRRLPLWIAVLALFLAPHIAGGAAAQSEPEPEGTPQKSSAQRQAREPAESPGGEASERGVRVEPRVVYEPPRRGAPRAKLGGGLRFAALRSRVTLYALAPDHVAHTLSPSPVFFWFVEPLPDPRTPIVFTLLDETSIDPVVEMRLPRPERPGIQAIDLAAHGVRLEPGVEYEWFVAVVVDRRDRSRDQVSRGYVRYVGEDPELGSIPRDASAAELASAGLWYDALASLSAAIEADPDASELVAQRTALLDQAGFDFDASR
jgi:hypothetical protein